MITAFIFTFCVNHYCISLHNTFHCISHLNYRDEKNHLPQEGDFAALITSFIFSKIETPKKSQGKE